MPASVCALAFLSLFDVLHVTARASFIGWHSGEGLTFTRPSPRSAKLWQGWRQEHGTQYFLTLPVAAGSFDFGENTEDFPRATEDDEDNDTKMRDRVDFSLDPYSDEAAAITSALGVKSGTHMELAKLSDLVVFWNERLNLVSRKDCTVDVVFGRHVLPSLALAFLPDCPFSPSAGGSAERKKVIDVGTGGGFPGLPLAILLPNVDFLLVDSVGKKLRAVEEMAEELGLRNVRTHHGRAEEMAEDILDGARHRGAYDVCVGRSVTSLPRFCFWVSDLIKKKQKIVEAASKGNEDAANEDGKLIYIIGGDVEDMVQTKASLQIPIDDLLQHNGTSDKRVMLFRAGEVAEIAAESGEVKRTRGSGKQRSNPKRRRKTAKGEWTKRDASMRKQRGYENFKRYEI